MTSQNSLIGDGDGDCDGGVITAQRNVHIWTKYANIQCSIHQKWHTTLRRTRFTCSFSIGIFFLPVGCVFVIGCQVTCLLSRSLCWCIFIRRQFYLFIFTLWFINVMCGTHNKKKTWIQFIAQLSPAASIFVVKFQASLKTASDCIEMLSSFAQDSYSLYE